MQTFTGKEYLQIDIANNFGLDGLDWHDRLGWFEQNEDQLDSLIKQADEPALFFAGVQAWKLTKQGKPSHYPISLDATSSGIQLLAALTGDRKSAELCNVVDTGHRRNAYTILYNMMVESIGEQAKIDKKEVKKAIMTSFYGSKAQPKNIFGEGKLLDVFHETMERETPGAWELNKAFLAMWDPEALSNDWVLPDNFHVHIKVMKTVKENVHFLNKPFEVSYSVNAPIKEGRSLGANSTHSVDGLGVREMTRACSYDPDQIQYVLDVIENRTNLYNIHTHKKDNEMVSILWDHYEKSGFLSLRILDHINPTNKNFVDRVEIFDAIAQLPAKPFDIMAVHDCFRCLPNYGNDLRKQYNIFLSKVAKSNMLSYIVSQIVGRQVNIGKLDDNLYKDILDADYALS